MADPAGLSAAVLVAKLCGQNVPILTMSIIPNSEVSVSLVSCGLSFLELRLNFISLPHTLSHIAICVLHWGFGRH